MLRESLQGWGATGHSVCESTLTPCKCWGIFPKRTKGPGRKLFDTQDISDTKCLVFPHQPILQFSETPAGCPTIQFSLDAIYLETVHTPQVKRSAPQDCPTRAADCSDGSPGCHTSVQPGYRSGVPRSPSSALIICSNSQNSEKHSTYYSQFITKGTIKSQNHSRMRRSTGQAWDGS